MSDNDNLKDLAAELNGHQVTDGNGNLVEDREEVETPVVEDPTESAPEKPQPEVSKVEEPTEELSSDLVVDESGKQYVPADRFNKVYGKWKAAEREKEQITKVRVPAEPIPTQPMSQGVDRQSLLETELLYTTMPEFDPENENYSPELDTLGGQIFKANPGITKTEAARRARGFARSIAQKQVTAKVQSRQVKVESAEGSITGKVLNRNSAPDTDKMSDVELEKYLKETGQW